MAELFDQHDAVHVVFGCPTTLRGEVLAHVWTVFGTTTKLGEMHRAVAHGMHRDILSAIGHLRLLGVWVRSLPRLARAFRRSRRMTRPWPVEQTATFLDRPLGDIRREFNIVL